MSKNKYLTGTYFLLGAIVLSFALTSCQDQFISSLQQEKIAVRAKGKAFTLMTGTTVINFTEDGAPGIFTARLSDEPVSDVVLDFSQVTKTSITAGVTEILEFIPEKIVFTSANYQVDQNVTIKVKQTNVRFQDRYHRVVLPRLDSMDTLYSQGETPVLQIAVLKGNTYSLISGTAVISFTEDGTTGVFLAHLSAQPVSDVVLDFSQAVQSNTTPGVIETLVFTPSKFTFTSSNYAIDQEMRISIGQTSTRGQDRHHQVVLPKLSSLDPFYSDIETPALDVTVLKGNTYALISGTTIISLTESGTAGIYTAHLSTKPLFNVTLNFATATQICTTPGITETLQFSPSSITFTTDNYNVDQTVSISLSNNNVVNGARHHKVTLPALSSTDPWYNGVETGALDVTIFEDDQNPIAYPVTPYMNDTSVETYPHIKISFNKEMDPATISSTTFTLVDNSAPGIALPISWNYYYDSGLNINYAAFAPKSHLKLGATYTATLSTGVKDIYGNPLTSGVNYSFSVKNWVIQPVGGVGYAGNNNQNSIYVTGAFAYSTYQDQSTGAGGMYITELSTDMSQNTVKSSIALGTESAKGLFVSGRYAYVANGNTGLRTVDVQNSSVPVIADTDATSGYAYSVQVYGNYAFVAAGTGGLDVFDLATSSNPVKVAGYTAGSKDYRWVYVINNYAYIANGSYGLLILDVSNPLSPVLVGSLDTSGIALGVHVWGNYAYVADYTSGMQIVDVSNPASPVLKGTFKDSTVESLSTVYVSGNTAYCGGHRLDQSTRYNGLFVVDISNPVSPQRIYTWGLFTNPTDPRGVFVKNTFVYLTLGRQGCQIFDVSNPYATTQVSSLNSIGNVKAVTVSGETAYVINDTQMKIVDVSNKLAPTVLGTHTTLNTTADVAASGTRAYIAIANGLEVVDVSTLSAPTRLGNITLPGTMYGIDVSGNYAYVAYTDGVYKVDISNPASMSVAASFFESDQTYGSTRKARVMGSYAYVAKWGDVGETNGLRVLNISNMSLAAAWEGNGKYINVEVLGTFAYLVNWNGQVTIFDITNPLSPGKRADISLASNGYAVAVQNHYIFAAQGTYGVRIEDSFNSFSPGIVEDFDTPGGTATGVFISGNYLYVADGADLKILYHPWYW